MPSIQPFDPFLDKKATQASPAKLLKGADENKPPTNFQQSFQGHFQGHLDPTKNTPNRFKKAEVRGDFKPLSRKAPEKDRDPSRLERSSIEKHPPERDRLDKKPKLGTEKFDAEKSVQSIDRRLENQDQEALAAKAGPGQTSQTPEGPLNTSSTKGAQAWNQAEGQTPTNQDSALTAALEDSKAGVVFLSPYFFPNLAENSASLTVLEGGAEGSSAARQSLFAGKNTELSTGRWSADSLNPNFAWQNGKNAEAGDKLASLPLDEVSKSWNDPKLSLDAKTQDLLKAHAEAFDQGAQAKVLASNPALSEKTLAEKLNKAEKQGEAKAEKINLGNREFEIKTSMQKQGSEKGFESFDGNFKQAASNRKQPGLDAFAKGFTAESFKLYSEQNQPSPPVLSPTNMKAFEENLVSLRTTGRENFFLDLKPEGLGRMDFRFIRNGKELRAEIAVQDLELAENLKKEIKHLRTSLEKHGFVVDDLKILVKEPPQNSLNFGAPFAQQNPNSDFLGGFQQQQSGAFTKKQANPPLAQARVQDEVRVERASRIKDPSQLIDVEA